MNYNYVIGVFVGYTLDTFINTHDIGIHVFGYLLLIYQTTGINISFEQTFLKSALRFSKTSVTTSTCLQKKMIIVHSVIC